MLLARRFLRRHPIGSTWREPHRWHQKRQSDKEATPSAKMTFCPNAPPMLFDDLGGEIKTQARAFSGCWVIALLFRPIEAIKHMRQVFLADPSALILHGD